MISDSQESSVDIAPTPNNLNNIWKSIQQTKHLSQAIDRQEYSHNKNRHPAHSRKVEFENRDEQNNLAHLLKKIKQLELQNDKLRSQLEDERQIRDQEVEMLRKDYEERLHKHLRKMKTVEKQNISANKEGGQVNRLYRQKQKLQLKIKALELQRRQAEAQHHRLMEMNGMYLQQLQSQHTTAHEQIGRGQQLLELEQANRTVVRLLQLLRRTEQYRQFAPMMQEVGSMHYLKNILKRLKANQLNVKPQQRKICSCRELKLSQKLVWSPVQCYKTMLQMKVKYDYLNEECIEQVLFQMNRIYTAKEEKTVHRVKSHYEQEILKLRKQLERTYDEILTKKQITRLKKELSAVKSVQKSRQPPRMDQLKDKGQLQDQIKLKERQIKLLKQRIRLFETENGYQDKSLYYEGTICALDKVLGELQNNEASLKQFQIRFRERVQQNMQPQDWLASYKQFFQGLQELNAGLVERVLDLKQSILTKMNKHE